jgi:hypothetical protein
MSAPRPAGGGDTSEAFVQRIRGVIGDVALDCDCRQRVTDALERFAVLEQHRIDRRHLLSARQHRATIAALVELLADLEDIGWQETDRSVFGELALLFEDVARHAQAGAEDLRLMDRDAPF